jgi:hypothetical protein
MRRPILLVLLINLNTWAAQANVVYRCENLYSEKPCPNAQTLEFTEVGTQRTRQRNQMTEQENRQADKLQQAREVQAKQFERATQKAHTEPQNNSPTSASSRTLSHQDQSEKKSGVIKPAFRAKSPASTTMN